ncbi:MAG: hypothetical protein WCE62_00635 [Polyangiales bacterium]
MSERHHLVVGVIVSLLFTGLVLSPALRAVNADSFPLSTFPMFSGAKRDPGLVLTQALAVFSDGARKPIPPALATGNEEVIQALRMIRDEVHGGRKRTSAFCREIARRIQRSGDSAWDDVVAVEIATSHFDTVAYFERGPTPVTRKTLERCPASP